MTTPTTLTAKLPHEKTFIDADFTPLLDTGATIVSYTCAAAYFRGVVDSNPTAILSGVAQVSGNIVSQLTQAGTPGTNYLLTFSIVDSEGQTQDIQLELPVVSLRLG